MNFDSAALELFIHASGESSRQIISKLKNWIFIWKRQTHRNAGGCGKRMVPLTGTGVILRISRAWKTRKVDAAISLIDFSIRNAVKCHRHHAYRIHPYVKKICWLPDF